MAGRLTLGRLRRRCWSAALLFCVSTGVGLAETAFDECEARASTKPDDEETARCFLDVGLKQNLLGEAHDRLQERIERYGNEASPWFYFYRGTLLWQRRACQGDATGDYLQAARGMEESGDLRGASRAWVNRARLQARCTRSFEAAREALEEAERTARASGDQITLFFAKDTRLSLLGRLGGDFAVIYQELREAWEEIRDVAPNDPDVRSAQQECLKSLGNLCYGLGRFREAQEWYEARRAYSEKNGNQQDVVSARFRLVRSRMALDLPGPTERERVLEELRSLLPDAVALDLPDLEANIRLHLAKMEHGPGADANLERCRQLAQGLGDQPLERLCSLALASHQVDYDPDSAGLLLSGIHGSGLFASRDPRALIDGRDDHLRVLWATSSRADALAGSERILADLEALRRPQTGLARSQILQGWSGTYYWLAGRLLQDANDDASPRDQRSPRRQAFAFMERLRAQELREILLLAGDDSPWLPPPPPNLLDQMEPALAKDEAMLSFQLSLWEDFYGRFAGGAWILASTRDGTRVHRLELDRLKLEPAVKTLIDQTDGQWNPPTLVALHGALLETALRELPENITRLVINPDGILHLLPFAALRPAEGAPTLGERFEISIVPSASLWLDWKKSEPTGATSAALILAAPDFLTTPDAGTEKRPHQRQDLGPLPYADREGEKVKKHLRGSGWPLGSSRLLKGENASEHRLKEADLKAFGLLHFATHAVVDTEQPWLSGVLLSSDEGSDEDGDDGWLRPEEIAELDLGGKVIVLSTCNSAAGGWLRGEGVMSLARAFFEAGAHAVVGTLRPLPDDLGERFFDDFYRHLGQGASLRQALAAVQRHWADQDLPASTWASVVVLGNGDLTPVPEGSGPPWLDPRWAGLALAGLALAGLALAGLALAGPALVRRHSAA